MWMKQLKRATVTCHHHHKFTAWMPCLGFPDIYICQDLALLFLSYRLQGKCATDFMLQRKFGNLSHYLANVRNQSDAIRNV